MIELSESQLNVVGQPLGGSLFLEGPAGTGKSTAGAARLAHLLDEAVPGSAILVLVPQRTLGFPYYEVLNQPDLTAGGPVSVMTLGGLARRMVDIFWPLVAEDAGFGQPDERPSFLSLEAAQYYMAHIVRPLLDEGYFESVTIDRNRLYSQLIDNLNKAALVGFPYTEIGPRLESAWPGDEAQRTVYRHVQDCVEQFRAYCLAHNLLDFSLQVDLFMRQLWRLPNVRDYAFGQFKHLIVDNIEEDTPVTHDLLRDWLPASESALVIYDQEAGYRRFLGSDPANAHTLRDLCDARIELTESYVMPPDIAAFGAHIRRSMNRDVIDVPGAGPDLPDPRGALRFDDHRYQPEMIDWVAEEIAGLVHDQGVEPGEIVVLAPFLSDALRFSLQNRLEEHNVPARSHRPSRALREEPAALCLLTLAQLAHPLWGRRPARYDVTYALMQAIDGLDLVRAQLLAGGVYKLNEREPLLRFDQLNGEIQGRVTFEFGNRYDRLREWLVGYAAEGAGDELDHFWSRLFGEVLAQEGFGFHSDFDAAGITASLIDSARKFRRIIDVPPGDRSIAQEYVEMVANGLIADQYIARWSLDERESVLLAPAYTFLMSNHPVSYQFWLNIGAQGWAERLYQPLTNPYVLSRQWDEGKVWRDEDEQRINSEALYRLALGLVRRCRTAIYLGYSELGEQGYEQRGALLDVIQRMLRRLAEV